MSMRKSFFLLFLILCLTSCSSVYYSAMDKMGIHKREILVDRVEKAKESQEEAKEQFADALEEFIAVTEFQGSNLETQYRKFNQEYQQSEAKAVEVRDRINSIEEVAEALFKEWEKELEAYTNASLRSTSAQQLRNTRARYNLVIRAMRDAEQKMDPVLNAFRDQVLFLKHNLNAQAIAALDQQSISIQEDIRTLIQQMEKSINEANAFIATLKS